MTCSIAIRGYNIAVRGYDTAARGYRWSEVRYGRIMNVARKCQSMPQRCARDFSNFCGQLHTRATRSIIAKKAKYVAKKAKTPCGQYFANAISYTKKYLREDDTIFGAAIQSCSSRLLASSTNSHPRGRAPQLFQREGRNSPRRRVVEEGVSPGRLLLGQLNSPI